MRHDYVRTLSDMQKRFRKIEADLVEQGIKFYPPTTAGERARTLWRLLKQRLVHGAAVEITASALKLDWHREELRRARAILIDMELIKLRGDGRYVLGQLGPFSKIEELIRDEYFFLRLAEAAVVALGTLMPKSKTRKTTRHAPRHKGVAPSRLGLSHKVQSAQSGASTQSREGIND